MRSTTPDDESVPTAAHHPVMTALARRVPLTLLLDLAEPFGPDSRGIHAREQPDVAWLPDPTQVPTRGPGPDRQPPDQPTKAW